MKQLKITHINTLVDVGGAAKTTMRLAALQRTMGHDAHVLAANPVPDGQYVHGLDPAPLPELVERCKLKGELYYEFQGSHRLIQNPQIQTSDILHFSNLHGSYFNPWSISALSHRKPVLSHEDLEALHASGFPIVLVHRTLPTLASIPSVTVENTEITRLLIDHLINVHGKRRILFMRGPDGQEDSMRREAGYRSALQANGIPLDEKLILNGEFERNIAYQVLNEYLDHEKQVVFDAVFTGDDDAAV